MNTVLSEPDSRSILAPQELELTILMPCLDEAETVESCVRKARGFLESQGIAGEVLVADNGSTDGSQALALAAGARVEHVAAKGYGSALLGGIHAARGRYVIMGDADDSYDFSRLTPFIDRLRGGHSMVVGNRFQGGIEPGAMPFLHRYLGNPVLSFVGRLFFRAPIGDFHCGLRGFDRNAILGLSLQSPGMEFASEMIVKTTLAKLSMVEVPTTLSPAGRTRPPHLRSWRDGWRHLRFLLMMSPRWLFLYPGLMLMVIGLLAQLMILQGPIMVRGVGFDIHTMLYASAGTVLGVQLIVFALLARAIGHLKQVLPPSRLFNYCLRLFSLERGILLGLLFFGGGLSLALLSVDLWLAANMSELDPTSMMRLAIPSVTFMLTGAEIIFASFILSFIDIKPRGEM